ncbi:YdcF family protein [Frankia sp. CiP3]|uniref:YdcF family protein n=1 Tax=Frankia sp. CiP3 TaxID=2880971 RepID=UPI001EF6702A|nr:YdcF family protein [Frankia sp. CiP3]
MTPVDLRQRRSRRLIAFAAAAVVFLIATARLFVWPATDPPQRVDAIVMYAGSPGRLARAVELARAGYAPMLAVSNPFGQDRCPVAIPGVQVICFRPDPLTTQGEARMTAQLAARYNWRSVLVVVGTPQDTRARLRLNRCYAGRILLATAAPPWYTWPYMIIYEWGATAKALIIQRTC